MPFQRGNKLGEGVARKAKGRDGRRHQFHDGPGGCGKHDPLCRRGPHDDLEKKDWCQCPSQRRMAGG